ncbi:UDP-glucuronosyltransferase 2A1-like isoform X2 [Chanos chanos]|uniref:UDP-glucuronosyltransferase n=1 Tax=Chanos chanos TaxID=29144 RepID=A0A6J2UL59_CHACN|nr:UDP-glucuronosyltransferase 2A1-like isoform X2 [Chanos chanos]
MHHSFSLLILSVMLLKVYAGKVLVFPVEGSHWINMKVLIEELHSRGHSIAVVRASNSWTIEEESPYYRSITVNLGRFDADSVSSFSARLLQLRREKNNFWTYLLLQMEVVEQLSKMHQDICNMMTLMFQDKILMNSLLDAKYDLILTDPAFGGGVFLARRLGLPLVLNVRWTDRAEAHFAIAPSPLSYVPVPGTELTDKMTFLQRLYFGPDVDYFSLFQDADIWLMRNDFTFEFPRPTMPNVVYMGGFQCKPSKPLPADLEGFVQSSGEHGVIIMSLGTLFSELPYDIADEIAAAFAQLPQKVIWRYTGPRPATLGNNTLLVDWLPQNDLLGHPKTRVFVAHGGTNGVQEAIYHGVPMVGLPLVFDQPDNLSRMNAKGTAKIVNIATLDRTVFLEALKEVLYEPSYRENMQRLSRLHRDQPMKPLDHAMFWIEYVMRNRGAPHLRTQSFRMSWMAYHSVDVILTLLAIVLIISLMTFSLIRLLCKRILLKNKIKHG